MRSGAAECSRTQLAGGVRTAGEDPGGEARHPKCMWDVNVCT